MQIKLEEDVKMKMKRENGGIEKPWFLSAASFSIESR
jgi:hypothetical protein